MSANNGDDQAISVQELVRRIDRQCATMGASNPNRLLLLQCRVAILWLVQRLPEPREVMTAGGIIVP